MDIFRKSINVILENQSDYGSFVASPRFNSYKFSWIRDGSFIAYALDVAGELEAAEKFFLWVSQTIEKYADKALNIEKKICNGEKLDKNSFLNARFMLNGCEENDTGWGNFQLDAYGTWLWALSQHIRITGRLDLLNMFRKSIDMSIKYIENLWYYPNYDIWEENADRIHTSTLACLYGGLNAINKYMDSEIIKSTQNRIKSYIFTNCVKDERFVKYIGSVDVDASLLWLTVPFEVVEPGNSVFINTVKSIEKELLCGEGMHRYKNDTYFGGGEWVLLSCWLGWYYSKIGNRNRAEELLNWVENTADINGFLPEQVCKNMNNASYYDYWVKKSGKPACPLLWSHAMYIILRKEIEK